MFEYIPDEAMAVLERTPASLQALLSGLPERWVRATEGEGTWSPYDVIGHLIHGERTDWMPRVRHILAGDERPFEPFDRTAQFRESQGKSLGELLATFASLRRENLAALRAIRLTDADLGRKGQHPAFGTVTLGQLVATWVAHDLDHVAQIARTMAKAYTTAVGPWSAYLSILHDRVHDGSGSRLHIRHQRGAVRPYLHGPSDLPEFLADVFGAVELESNGTSSERRHVEMQVGDSVVVIEAGELSPGVKPWVGSVYVYVQDVDAVFARAIAAGARVLAPVADKPYQERQGGFIDGAGNTWWVSSYRP